MSSPPDSPHATREFGVRTDRTAAAAHVLDALLAEQDASAICDTVVAAARAPLGMDVAFLSEFVGDQQAFRILDGAGESFGLRSERTLALEHSYCPRVARGALPPVVGDARTDPLVRDMPITAAAGVGAYISVPVRLRDGELYGTLCGLSHGEV